MISIEKGGVKGELKKKDSLNREATAARGPSLGSVLLCARAVNDQSLGTVVFRRGIGPAGAKMDLRISTNPQRARKLVGSCCEDNRRPVQICAAGMYLDQPR